MSFFKDVGNFFKDLGEGVTGSIKASNLQKEATAAQILANAQVTTQALILEEERAKRKQQTTIIVLLAVFGAPLLGLSLFLILKK